MSAKYGGRLLQYRRTDVPLYIPCLMHAYRHPMTTLLVLAWILIGFGARHAEAWEPAEQTEPSELAEVLLGQADERQMGRPMPPVQAHRLLAAPAPDAAPGHESPVPAPVPAASLSPADAAPAPAPESPSVEPIGLSPIRIGAP